MREIKFKNITDKISEFEFNSLSKKERIMRYASPLRAIIYFSLPTVIIMTILSLYNLADKLMAQLFAGPNIMKDPKIKNWFYEITGSYNMTLADAKGYINIATQYSYVIFNLGSGFASLIAIGASVLYSVEYGKRNYKKMSIVFNNGIIYSLFLGIMIAIVLFFFTAPAFGSILITIQEGSNSNPITTYLAWHYIYVFLLLMPLFAINYIFMSILRSQGKTYSLIVINITSLLLNIFLDWIFIKFGGLDLDGAMWATGISWIYSIIFVVLIMYYEKDKNIKFNFADFKIVKWKIARDSTLLGLTPFFIKTSNAFFSVISAIFITHLSSPPVGQPGSLIDAKGTYILQQMVSSMMPWMLVLLNVAIGFSQGVRILMAYSYGAKKYNRIKKIAFITLSILMVWICLFNITVLAFGPYMAMVFAFPPEYAFKYRWYIFFINYSCPLFAFTYTVITLFNSIKCPGRSATLSLLHSGLIIAILSVVGFFVSNYVYNNISHNYPGFIYIFFIGSNDLITSFFTFGIILAFIKKYRNEFIDYQISSKDFQHNNSVENIEIDNPEVIDSQNVSKKNPELNNLTEEIK